jgi:signal transduction histidine kinase
MLRKQLGCIEENMTRADHKIQDLLDASKVKAGHKLPINPNSCNMVSVASMVVDEFTMLHGHRFLLKSIEQLIGELDNDGLRRILENLISNAIKYGDNMKQIHITIADQNNKAMMEVTNFGRPIPIQDIASLFDPYKRADANQNIRGWGLGLNLVKGLAEAHGGHVLVKSSAGHCLTMFSNAIQTYSFVRSKI